MAVNLILKNNSGNAVKVELIDQYGGNFSATIESGMAQNHALLENSELIVEGTSVHVVVPEDENMEIVVAE